MYASETGGAGAGSSNSSPTPRPIHTQPETDSSSSSASSSAQYLPCFPQPTSFPDGNRQVHSDTSLSFGPAARVPLDMSTPFRSSFNDSIYASPSATHVANPGIYQSSAFSRALPVTPPPQSLSLSEATMVDGDTQDTEMALCASQVPLPTSPSRRLKVSMGPRAGCEKCRLRVPGHWMHMTE